MRFNEQITRIKKLINELSPDSSGFQELYDLVAHHPEVLEHLKFNSLKNFKEYLLSADYSEFDEIRKDVEFFVNRRQKYLKAEMDEIERVVQYLNREEGIDVSVDKIYHAFDDASEITLPKKVLDNLENTECNTIQKGEIKKVIELAKKYNKQDPRELAKALKSGDYKRPLILKFGDRFHLVAGNTRLCTAMALGIKPKVLIAEI
jgi:hypothetical protein